MNTPQNPWLQTAQQLQQSALQYWGQLLQPSPTAAAPVPGAAQNATPFAPAGGVDLSEMLAKVAGHPVQIEPTRLLQIQSEYLKDLAQLWSQGLQVKPPQINALPRPLGAATRCRPTPPPPTSSTPAP